MVALAETVRPARPSSSRQSHPSGSLRLAARRFEFDGELARWCNTLDHTMNGVQAGPPSAEVDNSMGTALHPRESERLLAVEETGLLDEPVDRVQQAAARLASEIFDVPIGAVSLVAENRQWFSAIHGLECRETSRDAAFCAHTILGEVPLVVEDAQSDPRFRENPLVTGDPRIRFYAGVPLRTSDQLPLGSLCVIDRRPRRPTEGQLEALSTLGSLVVAQLDMLRLHRRLRRETSQHRRTLDRERAIAAALPGAIAELRVDDGGDSVRITHASPRLQQLLGDAAATRGGADLLALVDPRDRRGLLAALSEPRKDLSRRVVEFRARPDGDAEDRWFELDAIGRRGRRAALWHAFIADITDRRRAAREVARLASIVDHSEEAILSFDLEGRFTSWNPAAERIFGRSADQALGQSVESVIPLERLEEHRAAIDRLLAGRGSTRLETTRLAASGERRAVLSAMSPLRDETGELIGVSEIISDVTRRRQVESQLAESLRVVDDVSHEFRTPLAVISEFSSIIADGIAGPVTDEQREYLSIVGGAVTDLNQMVEDLLDSSRLRAGSLRVERRGEAIESLMNSMRGALAAKANLRSIVVREEIADSLPEVFCDAGKTRRILSNLMTNAVKFSPDRGEVVVSARLAPGGDEVVLSVRDHGPGLTTEEIGRLFGRFEQLCTPHRATAKGFGLGLSIARELSWLNLGQLTVESRKGEGACFSFSVPVADHRAVLEHAAATIHALGADRDPLVLISARAVDPQETAGDLLVGWLCSSVFATDLVLPAGCCDGRTGRALLVGRSRAPQSWLDRLRQIHAKQRSESPERVPEAEFTLEASWPPGTSPSEWIESIRSQETSP